MKTWKRCLALVMTIAMLFSMFVLTASAAQPAVLDIEAEQTNSSPDVYKITVSLTTPNPVCTIDLRLYYPKDVFKLIGKTGTPDSAASNTAYNKLGQFLDKTEYECDIDEANGINDTIICGAGTGSFNFSRSPAANQYGTLDTDTYGCILFNWTANFDTLSYLYIADTKTAMFTFYMQVLDTAPDGTYEIGQFTGGKAWTIDYAVDGEIGSMFTGAQSKADLTINNASITVSSASAGPALTHEGRQVKMTVVDNAVVSGTEQLRVVSSISNDDWNNYFANTTDKDATTDKIVAVGFVAYKGQASTFNADTAKAVAQGTATDSNYAVATTDYIQYTGSGYRFGARVEYKTAVYDTTYLAFVHYKDASSNDAYVFYDTSTIYSLDFASNYDTITRDYIDFLNS